jgi:serine/threonine protein kinase
LQSQRQCPSSRRSRRANRLCHARIRASTLHPFKDGLIGGKYEILAQLGSGGLGDVFLARQHGPRGFLRTVVVRRLRPALDDGHAQATFLEQSGFTARLDHPNIVRVHELTQDGSDYLLVMEHVVGCQLGLLLATYRTDVPPAIR